MLTDSLDDFIVRLRKKWSQIPGGSHDRFHSSELLKLSDKKLLELWNYQNNISKTTREFWQSNYKFQFRDKNIFEIGSGLGFDGIYFIENGASWTFCDIVVENIELIKRVIKLKKIRNNFDFVYLSSSKDISCIKNKYDFIFAIGSLINLPFNLAKNETIIFLNILKKSGRWIELTYPKERWIREGSDDFSKWGLKTDGENTIWMEYYNLVKLRRRFFPYSIKPIVSINLENNAFNWFDLKISKFKKTKSSIHIDPPSKKINLPFIKFNNRKNKILWSELEKIFLKSYKSKSFLHIILNINVTKGSIGVSLFNQFQNSYSSEKIIDSSEFDKDIELFFEVCRGDIFLKIRNAFSDSDPSYILNEIIVNSIDEESYRFLV